MPPCIYDLHTHTFLCRHAEVVMPRVYFKLASEMGYRGVAYCCHCPFPGNAVTPAYRMAIEDFDIFMLMFEREREFAAAHLPDLDITLNMEVDYVPAQPQLTHEFISKYMGDFDCVVGSLHYYELMGGRSGLTHLAFVEQYFKEWRKALRTGWFNVMAHMDFYKVILGVPWVKQHRKETNRFAFAALDDMAEYNASRAAQGLDPVVLEVNTGGIQYNDDFLPTESILEYAAAKGIPMCLSSDCHFTPEIGRNFGGALRCLKRLGVTELCYFKKKRLHKYSLDEALASFKEINCAKRSTELKADPVYGISVQEQVDEMNDELNRRAFHKR